MPYVGRCISVYNHVAVGKRFGEDDGVRNMFWVHTVLRIQVCCGLASGTHNITLINANLRCLKALQLIKCNDH